MLSSKFTSVAMGPEVAKKQSSAAADMYNRRMSSVPMERQQSTASYYSLDMRHMSQQLYDHPCVVEIKRTESEPNSEVVEYMQHYQQVGARFQLNFERICLKIK